MDFRGAILTCDDAYLCIPAAALQVKRARHQRDVPIDLGLERRALHVIAQGVCVEGHQVQAGVAKREEELARREGLQVKTFNRWVDELAHRASNLNSDLLHSRRAQSEVHAALFILVDVKGAVGGFYFQSWGQGPRTVRKVSGTALSQREETTFGSRELQQPSRLVVEQGVLKRTIAT